MKKKITQHQFDALVVAIKILADIDRGKAIECLNRVILKVKLTDSETQFLKSLIKDLI